MNPAATLYGVTQEKVLLPESDLRSLRTLFVEGRHIGRRN